MPFDSSVSPTEGKCVVCNGAIVAKYVTEFHGSVIFGGPQRNARKVFKGYHCSGCGLKYEFIPENKKKMKKK